MKTKQVTERSTILALIVNIFLCIIKTIAGIFSGSMALISDALNSFSDVLASAALIISLKVSHSRPDDDHPFGHFRAEPLGGMFVAVVAALLGAQVIRESFMHLFFSYEITLNMWVFGIVFLAIIIKLFLFFLFSFWRKEHKSPALHALAVDSINDVAATGLVLINFLLYMWQIKYIDGIVGMLIGVWIIRNGVIIGLENIGYLMGKAPDESVIKNIQQHALRISAVKGVHDIRAHYVGLYVHAEVHIELEKGISLEKAHRIGKEVQKSIEGMEIIDRAFVHLDPR